MIFSLYHSKTNQRSFYRTSRLLNKLSQLSKKKKDYMFFHSDFSPTQTKYSSFYSTVTNALFFSLSLSLLQLFMISTSVSFKRQRSQHNCPTAGFEPATLRSYSRKVIPLSYPAKVVRVFLGFHERNKLELVKKKKKKNFFFFIDGLGWVAQGDCLLGVRLQSCGFESCRRTIML